MKRTFWLLVAIFLLFVACSGCSSRRVNTRFQQVYGLLNTAPDSALSLLEGVDRLSLSEKDHAVYSLLYTIAQDKSGWDVDSDSLIGIAYSYFKGREQDSLYAKCQYYMGKYYLLNDSTRMAEECFTNAMRVSKKNEDYYTAYLALEKLSKSLNGSDPKAAMNYAKEAYQIFADKFNDNLSNRFFLLLGISNSFSLAAEIDSARNYLNQALSCAQESGDAELLSSAYQSLSIIMRKQEKNDSALIYSKYSWDIAPRKDYSLASNLAYAYLIADSVTQSMDILTQLCQVKNSKIRRGAYQLLTECAFRTGNLHKAWEYTDSTLSIYRQTHESALKDRTAYFQANSQKIVVLESMKREQERQRYTYLISVLTLVFILLLLAFIYRSRTLLYRSRALEVEKEKEIEMIQYQAEKEKQELCLQQKEEQIKMLKTYISSIVNLKNRIQDAWKEEKRDVFIDDALWLEVEKFLNSVESNFVIRLKKVHSDLTQIDLIFCMLLRLGFCIKDLAEIYAISEDSLKQKQRKFKHKLGLNDSSVSLRKYLQNF